MPQLRGTRAVPESKHPPDIRLRVAILVRFMAAVGRVVTDAAEIGSVFALPDREPTLASVCSNDECQQSGKLT